MLASAGGHPSNSHWLVSIPSPKYHGLPHSVSSHHSITICSTHYHPSLPLAKTLLPHCHSLSLSTLRLPQISSSPPLMVLCHLTVCHDSRKVQDPTTSHSFILNILHQGSVVLTKHGSFKSLQQNLLRTNPPISLLPITTKHIARQSKHLL